MASRSLPRRWGFPALLLSALALCGPASARIESLETSNDERPLFHISSFGFEPRGRFELQLSRFEVFVPRSLDPETLKNMKFDMAFVLRESDMVNPPYLSPAAAEAKVCFHRAGALKPGFDTVFEITPKQWTNRNAQGEQLPTVFELDPVPRAGYYHLLFSNCEPETQVHFRLKLTQFNRLGGQVNYLSAGESSLPTWFFLLCGAFGAQLVLWLGALRKERDHVRSIHHLMTLVLAFKLVSLLFESVEYHYIKTTGTPHGWNVAYYVFSFVRGMLFFSVIALIGTGWSYLKPFMTERDKQLMLVILVVQGMVNLSLIVVDETSQGSQDWLTWRDLFHLLDMVCCCLVLLPIVWSIKHLRESASVDGKAARNLERLQRFRKFYLLVVLYIYFTRIIVFLLAATLPFEQAWIATVFSEVGALAFYGITGYLFRPQGVNPYLALGDVDDDDLPSRGVESATA